MVAKEASCSVKDDVLTQISQMEELGERILTYSRERANNKNALDLVGRRMHPLVVR